MKLLEIFDKPVEWTIELMTDTNTGYEFNINNIEYEVEFFKMVFRNLEVLLKNQNLYDELARKVQSFPDKKDVNIYGVQFSTGGNYEITGKVGSQAPQVFTTVIDIMKHYVRTHPNANILMFSSKEPSRNKLYDRMIRFFPSQLNFKTHKVEFRDNNYYFLLLQ